METAEPNALILDENSLKQENKKSWFSMGLLVKALVLVLVLGISYELYSGIKYLNAPLGLNNKSMETGKVNGQDIVPAGDSTQISLLADQSTYKVGDKVNIDVKLATFGRAISNAVVLIKYDPKILDTDGESFFTKAGVFSANPLVTNNALKGEIRISAGTGSPTSGYTGVGVMGQLRLIVKNSGSTQITIDKSVNGSSTSDFSDNKNILGEVTNLNLTIK